VRVLGAQQRLLSSRGLKQISYPCHMLIWETVDSQSPAHRGSTVVMRSKVRGGWLVNVIIAQVGMGMTFYPDPDHAWDGSSIQTDSP